MEYNFSDIEKKWQQYWKERRTFEVKTDPSRPKYYVLDMFPYPSGAGLHVGHPLGYIASDIYSRYKRLKGFNVLHPMGYDAFGLPAEQYAIQTGQHPAVTTAANINRYRSQLDRIGFSYDWSREVRTCEPGYYKWTQWIFLELFGSWFNHGTGKAEPVETLIAHFEKSGNTELNAACDETEPFSAAQWNAFSETKKQQILLNYRLAFLSEAMVNWCPALGTVLANEEVKDGVSERGGYPVERKLMKQWSLRISAYAERLLCGLDTIDWSDSLKEAQRNWIGKSEGARVKFLVDLPDNLKNKNYPAASATIRKYGTPTDARSASPRPSPEERGYDSDYNDSNHDVYEATGNLYDFRLKTCSLIDTGTFNEWTVNEGKPKWQTAQRDKWPSLKKFSKENRKNQTKAESLLWERLRNKKTGYRFRRQHAIGPFLADFVCLKHALVVEVDGAIHDFTKEYDRQRTEYLLNNGFNIIRFSNNQVESDIDTVILKIKSVIEELIQESNAGDKLKTNVENLILSFAGNKSLESGTQKAEPGSGSDSNLKSQNSYQINIPSPGGDQGEAMAETGLHIEVFTTRPDTIFGVTFLTLAPEHELVQLITTSEYAKKVEEYVAYAKNRSERERMADVKKITGQFTGAYAVHPFTGEKIPVWVGDYVLAGYGTGAVMAVPGHDSRDYAFAKHFNLPIKEVVSGGDLSVEAYESKDGIIVNSDFLNGLPAKEAIQKAIEKIESGGHGEKRVNYRLRDAVFGRQRYWGEPIPVYYKDGIPHPLPESELPLILPEVDKYLPTETGEPPLARAKNWKYKGEYDYEHTTMPGWAGSSWYYLRYMDVGNTGEFASREALDYWREVDLYLGGSEHATGHLLYVRFWTKFLHDLGYLSIDEPAKKLINQGMIQGTSCFVYRVNGTNRFVSYGLKNQYETTALHVDVNIVQNNILDIDAFRTWREEFSNAEFILEDGKYICGNEVEKMSKSKWNVVSPDLIIDQYGADCLRMYEMFLGPIEQSKPWNTNGITGVSNFLRKFWRLYFREGNFVVTDETPGRDELKALHKAIKKVTEDMERFSFNTSVSTFMICVNELTDLKCNKRAILEPLAILISPFAPHIAEELWQRLGHPTSIVNAVYPVHSDEYLTENEFEYPVSVNGKTRFKITLPLDLSKEQVEERVVASEDMAKWLRGGSPKKVIVVPGRIVNVVV